MSILSDMFSSAIIQRLGWTLLHSVWQFALIVALLSTLLAVLRRTSANARYLAACIGLAAMLTTSVATYWWLVARPTAELAITMTDDGSLPAQCIDEQDEVVANNFTESPPLVSPELPENARTTALATELAVVGNKGSSDEAEGATLATLCRQIIEGVVPWLPWVSLAWLGGVMVVSVRHLGGWVGVQRLRWVGTAKVSPDLSDRTRKLMDRMKISRPVRILQSSLTELPIVVGWVRPVVLLPASLLTGLSPRQLEAILAHELAHVRRYDYLVNLLQTAAETLLFYHPAVWWLSRRIRIEREHCCDDVAVTVCGNKVDYAEALAAVEQRRAAALAMAVAARGRMGSVLGRVRRVLGISAEDRPRWTQAIGGSAAVLVLIVALVSYMAATSEAQWGQGDLATTESSVPGPEDVDVPFAGNEDEDRVARVLERSGDEKHPAETQIPLATSEAVQVSKPGNAAKARRDEAIRGRVLDAAGKPVAGAKVFLSGPDTLLLIDGKDEFRSRTPAETDVQGRFVLARVDHKKANRLIVTAPSLHVWIEPGPWLDEELTIRLPEPATLVLRYDIEGDLPEVRFRLQLDHTKKLGWTGVVDSIQYPVAENRGQVTVMMTPGSYGLARLKPMRWRSGEMDTFRKNAFCDQRMLELKAGERKVVDFVRPAGGRVSGEVVGLPEDLLKDAFVYVCQTTERMEVPVGKRRLSVVHPVGVLDAFTSDETGRFTSARIPPGAYTVVAHVYKPGPQHRQSGELLPDLVGMAGVTVPEDKAPSSVRIEMTPTSHEAVEGATAGTASPWGPAVEGVQIRLWAQKKTWRVGEEVVLKYDARNQGQRNLVIDHGGTGCIDIWVNDRKYSPDQHILYTTWPTPFGPGQHHKGVSHGTGRRYPGLNLAGAPGKYKIRIVLTAHQNAISKPGQTDRTRWDDTYRRWVLKKNFQPPVVVSSNQIEIEILPAEPAVVPNTSKTIGSAESKAIKTEPLSFDPVIERVINEHAVGKDYLIDLDTGEHYTRPENLHSLVNLHAWARRVGIDASGVLASEGALTGFDIGAAIVDDASWERVTPQAIREALKQPDPRLVVRREDASIMICLGGKGVSLERVYAFQTREGGVGALQLVGPGDKDQRSVKIRYKLVPGTAASPPADHVWTYPMDQQPSVPEPGKSPLGAKK